MTTFSYTARSKTGEKMSGTIDADNKTDAIRKLERMRLVPVSLNAGTQPAPVSRPASGGLKTCGQAITSLVLGILSFVLFFMSFFLAVPAVVFGHVAMSRIKKKPRQIGGTGVARAGLVLGYLSIAVCFFSIAIPAFNSGRQRAIQARNPSAAAPVRRAAPQPERSFSEIVGESMRESISQTRTRSEISQPRSDFPNVLSVIRVLFEGQGIVDTGRYSRDQQEQIFANRFKGKQYFVYGEVTDVGTTTFGDRKYITLQVTSGHYFDVFPSENFDLLDYSKGQRIGFVGTWESLGTGIMVNHKIRQAQDPSSARYGSAPTPQERRGPDVPYNQQLFAQQLREYQKQFREVQRLNNDLRLKEVTEAAKGFIDDPKDISGWVGKAKGVNSGVFGSLWVDADCDGIQYSLYPRTGDSADTSVLDALKQISKGNWIEFSGRMTRSTRLTKTGAILDPDMHVVPTYVRVIQEK